MTTPTLPEFDFQPSPYRGPSAAEVLAQRQRFVNPAIFHYYREPLMIVEGSMQYLFDEQGRRYLDGFAGIVSVSVGHCHPHVLKAIEEQNRRLQHTTTIYLHPNLPAYAEKLAATFPDPLQVCYFVNSGSEANDLAMLMARTVTGAFDVVALRNGYHGGSQGTLGLTSHRTWKFPVPHHFGVHHAMAPYPYRGAYPADQPGAGERYAADVQEVIDFETSGRVAGFIAESIQGVGGSVVFPEGYLRAAYKHIREAGGLCIADEVQTGFGRTGKHFWGFELQGVIPDIVCMAKGIGNGCALGAVVTTPEIAKAFAQRIHFNTFGGNPVAMAQGQAVLEVIERDGIQANAARVGATLMAGLRQLEQKHNVIGEVRGEGLMIGVELVKDRLGKEPASAECLQVFERARELGLLIGKGGLWGNTLRIKPPMCLSQADARFMIEVLDLAFSEL